MYQTARMLAITLSRSAFAVCITRLAMRPAKSFWKNGQLCRTTCQWLCQRIRQVAPGSALVPDRDVDQDTSGPTSSTSAIIPASTAIAASSAACAVRRLHQRHQPPDEERNHRVEQRHAPSSPRTWPRTSPSSASRSASRTRAVPAAARRPSGLAVAGMSKSTSFTEDVLRSLRRAPRNARESPASLPAGSTIADSYGRRAARLRKIASRCRRSATASRAAGSRAPVSLPRLFSAVLERGDAQRCPRRARACGRARRGCRSRACTPHSPRRAASRAARGTARWPRRARARRELGAPRRARAPWR